MIDGLPVIDAVIHAYNMDPANFANRFAAPLCDLVYHAVTGTALPGYAPTAEQFYRNWSIEEAVDQVFVESDTDLAVYHVLPIYSFHDGLCSLEKAIEAQQRWPNRTDSMSRYIVQKPISRSSSTATSTPLRGSARVRANRFPATAGSQSAGVEPGGAKSQS